MNIQTRCRPGDLALVIHDVPECASNIGRFVEVDGPLAMSPEPGLPCWLIRPVVAEPWAVTRGPTLHHEVVDWSSRVEHPDVWLLPVHREDALSLEEMQAYGRMQDQMDRALLELDAASSAGQPPP